MITRMVKATLLAMAVAAIVQSLPDIKRYLDDPSKVGAVEAVYAQIRAACARGVGVLLISSELDELLSVAHRVVVLYRGRVMGECRAEPSARDHIGALMAGHAVEKA